MDDNLLHVVISSVICFVLIAFRCGYRLLSNCRIHTACHRTWHSDDVWMAVAVVPLVGRAVCIAMYSELTDNPNATPSHEVLALKLLLPGRLTYAGFEWCLKFCIVSFYFRLKDGSKYMERGSKFTWWFITVTFVAIIFATLLECRPLSLFWFYDPVDPSNKYHCQEGLANLLTMAITNIATDVALIILPIPVLLKMSLSRAKKLQLILLFSVGAFVIAVTAARLPLIIISSIEQDIRSMWASIEMATSCIVANFAFYYAQLKDMRDGHANSHAPLSASEQQRRDSAHPQRSIDSIDLEKFNLRSTWSPTRSTFSEEKLRVIHVER